MIIKTIKEAKDLGYTSVIFGKWNYCGIFDTKYFDAKCRLPEQVINSQEAPINLEERISRVYNPDTQDTKSVCEYRITFYWEDSIGHHRKVKTVDRDWIHWDEIRKDHPELGW